ncbi:MAG TPA: flagellar motor stator protein MotA [Bryobacteraceae bacterium]|nr:flagellar motor stator protein MotA [Bryobacteraceae bacterium]
MLIVIGLLCVFAAVLGGFAMEKGNLLVLLQPSELLIICGAAIGIVLVSNPPRQMRQTWRAVQTIFRPSRYTPAFYLSTLRMLYEVFSFARRTGGPELESQVEKPSQSPIFKRYPEFLNDVGARTFLCDSFRMAIAAGVAGAEMDRLMMLDMAAQKRENRQPVTSLSAIADALPGLGIVAAVLGVVVTMQSLGGPASEIGHKVAAALVGTFMGILLCYGVVGPIAFHLQCRNDERAEYLQVMRVAMVAFMNGSSPLVAVEFGRRSIPEGVRPGFDQMEGALRRGGSRTEAMAAVNGA